MEPEFWQDWHRRGIVQQATSETLGEWLAQRLAEDGRLYAYCGFDPTSDSLHIGNLMPVFGLRRLKAVGITPIAVVGGATGMIGDPSGKSAERTLMDEDRLATNTAALAAQLEQLLDGEVGKDFLLIDNNEWIGPMTVVDFLRDVGKHFSVNMMVHKESVRARMEDTERGISFTEFSYMLLQAYDFLHLFESHDCRMQVGGSDQWGNITAGIDLIHHKHHGEEVHGLTFPLITTSTGDKFGKTERGAVWIDPNRTHPYFMYKYFFHTADADVMRFLNYFTFLSHSELDELARQTESEPHRRAGQKTLAREVTGLVHGADVAEACAGLEVAMHSDDVDAFEQYARQLRLDRPESVSSEDQANSPVAHRPYGDLSGDGVSAVDLAVETGLFKSKSDVRREIKSKNSGFRIAGEQVSDPEFRITSDLLGDRRVLQIRKGKKNKRMICFHD